MTITTNSPADFRSLEIFFLPRFTPGKAFKEVMDKIEFEKGLNQFNEFLEPWQAVGEPVQHRIFTAKCAKIATLAPGASAGEKPL